MARHTFAVKVCLGNRLPIETLSKMLEHTNLRITQAYTRITYRKVTKDMKVLKNKLKDWKSESGPVKSEDIWWHLMPTGSGGLQRHENADIFVSNQKGQLMGTIITRLDKEVLHFFDEMKRISDLIDHLSANNQHLLDGENYLTDTELAGKLKLSKRTLLDYRRDGVLPYYQIGGKILYRENDIVQLLEKNRKEAFWNPVPFIGKAIPPHPLEYSLSLFIIFCICSLHAFQEFLSWICI